MIKRKELIASGDAAKAYLAYPAKLMIAANRRDTIYKLHKDYSTEVIDLKTVRKEARVVSVRNE